VSGFTAAAAAYRAVKRRISPYRAFKLVKMLSLHHRIQGSPGILEAVEDLVTFLVDEAPDTVEVDYYSYTGQKAPDWLPVPIEWRVHDAQVEGPSWTLRLVDHPTLAAAHSPPSDGWVEGTVARPQGDPLDPASYEGLQDKIVLVEKWHRLAYRLAARAGAAAVILTGENRFHDATPYYGLFITPREASELATPAVSLPWSLASKLEGERIRLRVDADIGSGPGRVPVLVAWIGDKNAPGPVITGHVCHPAPGANDNASGAASALEAIIALGEAIEAGDTPEPEATVRAILIPEYMGTLLALEGWLAPLAQANVNVDMVGRASPHAARHRILYAPITWGASRVGDALYDVALAATGTRLEYYMPGSDHDAFLAYGVDAAILNQWPDTFYHTSRDDADTIDPERLATAAAEAAAAAALLAGGAKPTGAARTTLVDGILARAAGDPDWAGLAASIVPVRYGLPPRPGHTNWKPVGDERVLEPLVPLPLAPETHIGAEEAARLYRALARLGDYNALVLREAFYAARSGYTVARLHAELAAAYGPARVPGEALQAALEALEEAGLLKLR